MDMNNNSHLRIVVLVVILISISIGIGLAMRRAGQDESSTFFSQFVMSGGPIVWFLLVPLSLVTIHLVINYCISIRRKTLLPSEIGPQIVSMLREYGYKQLATRLRGSNDFVSTAVVRVMTQPLADRRHTQMRSVVAESLQEQSMKLLRKIEWSNIIGNVAPMIGLFGTVFGMIKLFDQIVSAGGQPRPDQMAEGISVALVTTFWGLLVAIPSLAIHGIFRNRIETLVSEASLQAESVVAEINRTIRIELRQSQERTPEQPSTEMTS